MKKIFFFSLALLGFIVVADAAPVVGTQRRGTTTATTNTTAAPATNSARAAAVPAGRANARATAPSTATVSARSATSATPTVSARSATTAPIVNSARAASTQKVVGGGTTVAAAAKNVVVNELCQQKYEGCMDSFCMIDNASGGRCICNNRNKELNDILYEIEKLDARSYQMATEGVERLEMGDDAAAAIAKANAAANALTAGGASGIEIGSTASMGTSSSSAVSTRRTLDLSMWDDDYWDDVSEEITGVSAKMQSIEGKTGDALHNAAAEICRAQMPECANDLNMLQMIYSQRVKADCSAYENDLKKRRTASVNKLAAAEKALRETALDQLRTANKWDLGQCTVEFKKCMQTTGGCGTDFSNCANMYAMDATNSAQTGRAGKKNYTVKGASTTIDIAASTYDALMSKKPLCESVTKNCTNVATQVWDTFLREVAPQLKSAELIAEDKVRQDCVGNISSCFQKACKDNIDPNDPEGSYDLCLTRPGTMLNLCKIPLNACGIKSTDEKAASESSIWGFVLAKLASMRVDSCTAQVKECLTSEERCGSDYSECVGLDTDTIMRMCPYDKLVGCQKVYDGQNIQGDAVYNEIANMVQGIMLNIDNNMLALCQNAANEAMVRVCGDTESCNGWVVDDGTGTRTLEYKICQYTGEGSNTIIDYTKCRTSIEQITDGDLRANTKFASVLQGLINWDEVMIDENGNLTMSGDYLSSTPSVSVKLGELSVANAYRADASPFISKYLETSKISATSDRGKKLSAELAALQNDINNAIKTIEADPTVQFCMTGREVQGMNNTLIGRKGEGAARYPTLTHQMRTIIANQALKAVKEAYYVRYDELYQQMLKDYTAVSVRAAELANEDTEAARVEYGRQACLSMATGAGVTQTVESTAAGLGSYSLNLPDGVIAMPYMLSRLGSEASAVQSYSSAELTATVEKNEKKERNKITVTYSLEDRNCHKCVTSSYCTNWQHKTWFRSAKCKAWSETTEQCTDSKF
ncbi:hypothetical protein LJC18_04135 [Lachnospiraceae bacterium OttesenSCG-928-E19]|nr:hypothetical protein [Lachnospiraceae bacterium OttesenSCG-928-E19]